MEHYACLLNGRLYGIGDLKYMNELFKDYVVACGMYGKNEVTFRIVRYNSKEELKMLVKDGENRSLDDWLR